MVTVIDVASRKVRRRDPGRRRAGGHGRQPRRQDRGQHLRDHQHGALHRHRRPTRSPTTCWSTSGRASPSSPPTTPRSGCQPEIGGTVSVIDNATREVKHKITLRDPGRARRRRSSRSASGSPRTAARPSWRSGRPTGSRWSTPRPTRSRTTCWSASGSGSSPSRPTRSSSTRTNGVSNDISVIDVENDEVIKSVPVGSFPGASPSRTEAPAARLGWCADARRATRDARYGGAQPDWREPAGTTDLQRRAPSGRWPEAARTTEGYDLKSSLTRT